MRLELTDLAIKKLRYEAKQLTYWDTILPAFGLRVSPRTKSFVVMYGKKRQLKTLGRYPDTSLKAARALAVAFLGQESPTPQKTFLEAKMGFLRDARGRLKSETAKQYEQYLTILDFGDTPLSEISRADVQEKLTHYDGKPWAQNYAFATLKVFFNYCVSNEYLLRSPLWRVKPPNKTISRSRVLTDAELARLWNATEDDTYGRMVRVMILTGQRRTEVRNLKPEDVADGLVTFHTKGDKLNILPVTPLVEKELKYLPFTFANWSYNLRKLTDEARVDCTHHDLRRTLATKLAQLGVHDIVIERILGHATNPVKHTYNRYSYLDEVKDALLRYEQLIRRITTA